MPNSQHSSYLSKQEEINGDHYSGKFIIGWMYYFAHILRCFKAVVDHKLKKVLDHKILNAETVPFV